MMELTMVGKNVWRQQNVGDDGGGGDNRVEVIKLWCWNNMMEVTNMNEIISTEEVINMIEIGNGDIKNDGEIIWPGNCMMGVIWWIWWYGRYNEYDGDNIWWRWQYGGQMWMK